MIEIVDNLTGGGGGGGGHSIGTLRDTEGWSYVSRVLPFTMRHCVLLVREIFVLAKDCVDVERMCLAVLYLCII